MSTETFPFCHTCHCDILPRCGLRHKPSKLWGFTHLILYDLSSQWWKEMTKKVFPFMGCIFFNSSMFLSIPQVEYQNNPFTLLLSSLPSPGVLPNSLSIRLISLFWSSDSWTRGQCWATMLQQTPRPQQQGSKDTKLLGLWLRMRNSSTRCSMGTLLDSRVQVNFVPLQKINDLDIRADPGVFLMLAG